MDTREITSIKPASLLVGELEVVGSDKFQIDDTDFMISPLNADASLYISSIHHGIECDKAIADIKAGEYTKVTGNVPNTVMYVNTSETFYIKH